MTDIKYIHHLFKLKMNKLDSNANYDLPPAFIDTIVWEALNEYIEIFYSGNTKNYQISIESSQQRLDMLKDFIKTYPDISFLSPVSSSNYGEFKIDKFLLSDKEYRHLLKVSGKDSVCNKLMNIETALYNEIERKLKNQFEKPSVLWQRALGLITKDHLLVYCINSISELYLSYVKTPIKPFFGGYDSLEFLQGDLTAPSSISPQINCELSKDYANILTDIMTSIASVNINDLQKGQFLVQKTNNL